MWIHDRQSHFNTVFIIRSPPLLPPHPPPSHAVSVTLTRDCCPFGETAAAEQYVGEWRIVSNKDRIEEWGGERTEGGSEGEGEGGVRGRGE